MIQLGEISKAEAARYMGIRNAPDDMTAELLDRYEKIVRERLRPAYAYREAQLTFSKEGIYLSGLSVPLTGVSIHKLLADCKSAVVLAATVSAEADKLIRQTSAQNMAAALVVDALCGAAVERLCDIAEQEIFGNMPRNMRTARFSAGYGDLPIQLQRELLNYLDAYRRIGLSCTENHLLTPTKSVTAIIGINTNP